MEFDLDSLSNEKLEVLARIHAHLCGDGNLCYYKTSEKDRINRASISYFNTNIDLINSFRNDMTDFFGVKMTYMPKLIKVSVQSIRIADALSKLGKYGTRDWRIPELIKNSNKDIKLEWVKAFCYDEAYTPKNRKVIRIKSMNKNGLQDIKELLRLIDIDSWITGINCDNSWYLNIRKMRELENFYKKPSRKKIIAGGRRS